MIIKNLDYEKIKEIKDPIVIYGIGGGFGNVARLVGIKLIKELKAEMIGKFTVYGGFMDSFIVDKKGKILDIFSYKIYRANYNNQDFIILSGITQPFVVENPFSTFATYHRYKLAFEFMKLSKKIKAKEVLIIGGFASPNQLEPENPKLYILNNKYFDIKKIENQNIEFEKLKDIRMMGVPAIMIYISNLFKLPSLSIWAQTYFTPELKGYLAASKVIEFINKVYGLNINIDDYKEKGFKLKEKIEKRIQKIQNMQNNQMNPFMQNINQNPDKKNLSYYFG